MATYPSPIIAAAGDNVALATAGGIATQSSYWSANWPASNCINGITTSNSNNQLCHTKRGSDPNEWWDLQLPAAVPIDTIVIHNRTNCCSSRILGLYVLVADSPFPPGSDAASLSAARAQAKFEYLIDQDVTITTIDVGHLLGEYVRIQKSGVGINAGAAINLLEIEVYEGLPVDLLTIKAVSDDTPNVGDTVTFTITVENVSTIDASNITVHDAIPSGFGNITNISNDGSQNATGDIDWLLPSLTAGASVSLTFDAEVLPP